MILRAQVFLCLWERWVNWFSLGLMRHFAKAFSNIRTEKFWIDEPTDHIRLFCCPVPGTLLVWLNGTPPFEIECDGQMLRLGVLRDGDRVIARYQQET